jgi:hypothetical protein
MECLPCTVCPVCHGNKVGGVCHARFAQSAMLSLPLETVTEGAARANTCYGLPIMCLPCTVRTVWCWNVTRVYTYGVYG